MAYDDKNIKPDEALEISANKELKILFNSSLTSLTKFFYSYEDPNVEKYYHWTFHLLMPL